jgi:hypothetical protein
LAFYIAGTVSVLVFWIATARMHSLGVRVDSLSAFILYVALPIGAALWCFTATRFKPIRRVQFLGLSISVVVASYLMEILLAVFFSSAPPEGQMLMWMRSASAASLSAKLGRPIDLRGAEQVLAESQRTGDVVPILPPTFVMDTVGGEFHSALRINGTEAVALGAISRRTTLLCNENGDWISYRADRRGFNNPDSAWNVPDLDVALLGDSFTHGYCVPPDQSFASLIRKQVPRTLNLGMANDGPLLELATLSELLPAYRPKVILWFYFEGNDLTDLQHERKTPLVANYLNEHFTQNLLRDQDQVDRAIADELPRFIQEGRQHDEQRPRNAARYALAAALKLTAVRERLGLLAGLTEEETAAARDFDGANFDAFRRVMSEARRRADEWNGQLYFVYLPAWERFTGRYRSPGEAKRDDVLRIVRELGLPIIDTVPAFSAQGDPLALFPFRTPGHFTEAGHRLVADEVLRYLRSNHVAGGRSDSAVRIAAVDAATASSARNRR